jgi:predicted ABC-type ATPase
MQRDSSSSQLRLRVFAGPNGSGKSTVIKSIKDVKAEGKPIDFGIYINADDIASALKANSFTFKTYDVETAKEDILSFAERSGLLGDEFSLENLNYCFTLKGDSLKLVATESLERLAQIIARFLREILLSQNKRFSFETVFSHESNLEIMKRAKNAGYKVYLYFVSTESPEINIFRVKLRVKQNGHDVPEDRIRKRYKRSLELMYEASQIAYQAFFFDNSQNDKPFTLAAHFKKSGRKKIWDKIPTEQVPKWFKIHYKKK